MACVASFTATPSRWCQTCARTGCQCHLVTINGNHSCCHKLIGNAGNGETAGSLQDKHTKPDQNRANTGTFPSWFYNIDIFIETWPRRLETIKIVFLCFYSRLILVCQWNYKAEAWCMASVWRDHHNVVISAMQLGCQPDYQHIVQNYVLAINMLKLAIWSYSKWLVFCIIISLLVSTKPLYKLFTLRGTDFTD